MNTSELYFSFFGDGFDPEIITNQLNILPSSSHRQGDETQYSKNAKFSYWAISTGKNISDHPDFYEMSKSLIQILLPKMDKVIALKNQYNLKISLQAAITYKQDTGKPIIGFDTDVINFLANVGASIDVDIY